MSVEARLFLGYHQNKEIKLHLIQSKRWSEARTAPQMNDLIETQWQQKEYIGLFIPSLLSCNQLKEMEQKVKMQLQGYCPKINLDKYSPYLLSQLFLC